MLRRGTLDDNRLVVIKKKAYGGLHARKICRDISISSMVSGQKNFIKLLGCCLEFTCPVLVCEYAEGITQNDLHQIDPTLPWNTRIKIARDISNSLAYLHTAFSTTFIHKNVHPRNVFLDVKGVAKLGDFRNCVTIPQGESFVREYKLEGTYGYLDPNYMSKGIITENVDVYSFGVFMLVLLSRRTPGLDDELHPDFLTELAKNGRFVEILDPNLLENIGDFAEQELCRMQAFFLLSLKCIGVRGEVPEMMEVSKELKRIERS
ncbi:probable inactive receptor-like protein kinase At1g65250 [Capsella rubella]|uniref:probable inactive receptor-like protein kinase At1g65250 n=1 Tax=Capsella rubella TaxID=81985 RepID=UPI000CD55E81|nr:probable inactive receptor-like protein kinase At1g65250 [Capsella rubella]